VIVRCWNCGNDHEVSTDDVRRHERARIIALLDVEARLAGTCGDVYRQNALTQAISLIEQS
jgi:hypothetical protein